MDITTSNKIDQTSKLETKKSESTLRVALAGNPNSGKTSLFNCLTGASQKVGNWSGVTVEIIEGTAKLKNKSVTVVDLPGTYSLSTCSLEELAARNFIVNEKPDVVVDVVDATNLDRHLYLTIQLLELGIRPILALNMWDEVLSKGISIDCKKLGELLGLTVVQTNARNGKGIDNLLEAAIAQGESKSKPDTAFSVKLPMEIEKAVVELESLVNKSVDEKYNARWIALQLFEHDKQTERFIISNNRAKEILSLRDRHEENLKKILGDAPDSYIAEARYGLVAGAMKETITIKNVNRVEISDKIDSILTHRIWAYPVFIIFMWLLFQTTFKLGEIPMGWIQALFGWFGVVATKLIPSGVFQDLIVNGIIAGVGGVIIFLPNILILFLGISLMEDTGYMARAAFIMDKLMHRIGLHGKSFIPMLMGLGCSVPAIMAARTLESPKDRIKTILLTPLISCSARLPIFVLFAGALFPKQAGNMVFLFQVIFGFAAFILMGFLFKHSLFRNSEDYPFVMELPPYRIPTFRSVVIHMWHKTQHYLKKMGGVVLIFSVILWWAGAYPKAPLIVKSFDDKLDMVKSDISISGIDQKKAIKNLENEKHAALMEQTYIGRIGKIIEPVVKTFGTDWRGAVSLTTGFVTKEVVVGSMGVLYAVGDDQNEESESLQAKIREAFTPLSAFTFMLFALLYTPCLVALVTVIRELKNWKWSVFSVCYQLIFAWTSATLVYQIGKLLGIG